MVDPSDYQRQALETSEFAHEGDPNSVFETACGLASEAGSILDVYKLHLSGRLAFSAKEDLLRQELGDLLWYTAVVTSTLGRDLREVLTDNLNRTYHYQVEKLHLATTAPDPDADTASFDAYQAAAQRTSRHGEGNGEKIPIPPMFGLMAKVGDILRVYNEALRSKAEVGEKTATELCILLGDLIWYIAEVSRLVGMRLDDVASRNLARIHDLRSPEPFEAAPLALEGPDCPLTERFPRRMTIDFQPSTGIDGIARAKMVLVEAIPNAFPDGPVLVDQKLRGYEVGSPVGNVLDDNERGADGYRYHDAIHLGFVAVLGWSPVVRKLLEIKRKCDDDTDRIEDGAKATAKEEAIAAMLAEFAKSRRGFRDGRHIPSETLGIVAMIVRGLEVESASGWLWRRAIQQGFEAMYRLLENDGGRLVLDLDQQTLEFVRSE